MNVGVPGQGNETDFFLLIGLMAVMFLAMAGYFHRRGWL
jgi:Mg2+ and Co2+ transporter CorA